MEPADGREEGKGFLHPHPVQRRLMLSINPCLPWLSTEVPGVQGEHSVLPLSCSVGQSQTVGNPEQLWGGRLGLKNAMGL